MDTKRVLLVDDHPLMRRGLYEVLEEVPEVEVCGEAEDVGEALEKFRTLHPDLVIIDVALPSGSGLDLAKNVRSLDGDVRILVLSMHDDTLYAERALHAGALGYINKSRPGPEIAEAVRKVLRGEIALSPATSDRLLRRAVTGSSSPGSAIESLSDRELEIFELIGRGMSTRAIAEKLCLSIKTIETHREHLKEKLNLESGAELNRYAALWAHDPM